MTVKSRIFLHCTGPFRVSHASDAFEQPGDDQPRTPCATCGLQIPFTAAKIGLPKWNVSVCSDACADNFAARIAEPRKIATVWENRPEGSEYLGSITEHESGELYGWRCSGDHGRDCNGCTFSGYTDAHGATCGLLLHTEAGMDISVDPVTPPEPAPRPLLELIASELAKLESEERGKRRSVHMSRSTWRSLAPEGTELLSDEDVIRRLFGLPVYLDESMAHGAFRLDIDPDPLPLEAQQLMLLPYMSDAVAVAMPWLSDGAVRDMTRRAWKRFTGGHAEHGDSLFRKTREEIIEEICDELADAAVYAARLRQINNAEKKAEA